MAHNRLLLALVFAATSLACGGDGPADPTPDNGTQTVTLTGGLQFQPADLTIDPGTTVRWVNGAAVFHTVTPTTTSQPGVWARATRSTTGTVLTHTFTVPGQVYNYFCEVHSGMVGVIRVR